jgi:peptidyl-prolyl cis-trans isomerase C
MSKELALAVALLLLISASCRKAPVFGESPSAAPSAAASAAPAASAASPGATAEPSAVTVQLPTKPIPAQLPNVLARVNGEDVKKADFDLLMRNIEAGSPVPPDRRDEVVRRALDQLVTYTVLQQEARKQKISVTDAEVDERFKSLRAQFPTEEAFNQALADRKMTSDRLRADARHQLLIGKMMEAQVAGVPQATDDEARAFYDKNPDKFKTPDAVRASHILLMADEKADPATKQAVRAKIDALLVRVKKGEDFAALAKEHSQDPTSAVRGGDLNYFGWGRMVPAFEQAAFALAPGQTSDVVTTPFGYHIIKVTDRKAAGTTPFEQVSERIKQFLVEQRKQQHADAFIDQLKKKAKIEVLI